MFFLFSLLCFLAIDFHRVDLPGTSAFLELVVIEPSQTLGTSVPRKSPLIGASVRVGTRRLREQSYHDNLTS